MASASDLETPALRTRNAGVFSYPPPTKYPFGKLHFFSEEGRHVHAKARLAEGKQVRPIKNVVKCLATFHHRVRLVRLMRIVSHSHC